MQVLAYSVPELQFLSLRGNDTLGHHGWSTLLSKITAGGGLASLTTLNLQDCNIPTSCRRELQAFFRVCPALKAVEITGMAVGGGRGGARAGNDELDQLIHEAQSDQWIEELWQISGTTAGYSHTGGHGTAGEEGAAVASRVAAAGVMARSAAGAFSASPLRPSTAAAMVRGGDISESVDREAATQQKLMGFEESMARQR